MSWRLTIPSPFFVLGCCWFHVPRTCRLRYVSGFTLWRFIIIGVAVFFDVIFIITPLFSLLLRFHPLLTPVQSVGPVLVPDFLSLSHIKVFEVFWVVLLPIQLFSLRLVLLLLTQQLVVLMFEFLLPAESKPLT